MDEQSLIATEHARRAAMVRGDAGALGAMICDRFHYAHINGQIDDRDTYLARIASGNLLCPHTSTRDLKPLVRPGYALLTGVSTIGYRWIDGGPEGEVTTLFTAVWEWHGDRWRLAAYASTPMP
jgi:hypothetical protein